MPPRYAIIGAGPSGLAGARALDRAGVVFDGYESGAEVGGLWNIDNPRSTMYESAHLISSRTTTEFAEFPMDSTIDYPGHRELRRYFGDYAAAFDLARHFRFNTEVERLTRTDAGGWLLRARAADGSISEETYSGVILANGTLAEPWVPSFSGEFTGEIRHSSSYKKASSFAGKRVLVIGAGNSGCDVAVDAVHHAASVDMSVRRGYYFVPRVRAVLEAALASGVRRVVVSSSGAAYGYHADNPEWLVETDSLRGNDSFPYSRHKRLVEEMLAGYRSAHPELEQVVFRIGTILGPTVSNQITALWDQRRVLAIRGAASQFVFAWVDDVVGAMVQAVVGDTTGIFNVAGDGRLTVDQIAGLLGKKTLVLPAGMLALALRVGHALRLTVHGPEQVKFLRYRPVLLNTRLKTEFGYRPRLTSREAFDRYCATKGLGGDSR